METPIAQITCRYPAFEHVGSRERKGYNPLSVGRQQRALPREKKRLREERQDGIVAVVVAEKNERDDLTAH